MDIQSPNLVNSPGSPTEHWLVPKVATPNNALWKTAVIISNAGFSGTLTNAVVAVEGVSNSIIGNNCKSDGSDIFFTAADGVTPLTFEKKYFFQSLPVAAFKFLVKIPALSSSGNTTIYMWYGNLNQTSLADGPNTFTAWDRAYIFKQGATADLLNDKNGSDSVSTVGTLTWNSAGYLVKDSTHDGYVDVPTAGISATGDFTVCIGVQNTGQAINSRTLLYIADTSGGANRNEVQLQTNSSGQLQMYYNYHGGFATENTSFFINNDGKVHYVYFSKHGSVWSLFYEGANSPTNLNNSGHLTTFDKFYVFADNTAANGTRFNLNSLYIQQSYTVGLNTGNLFYWTRASIQASQLYGSFTGLKASTTAGQWNEYSGGSWVGIHKLTGLDFLSTGKAISGDTINANTFSSTNYRSQNGKRNMGYIEFGTGQLRSSDSVYQYDGVDGQMYMPSVYLANLNNWQIPFQNNGANQIQGSNSLLFDATNKVFSVNTDSQIHPVQFQGGNTVGDPSSAYGSASYYSIPSDPTSSSGEGVTFNYELGVADLAGSNSINVNYFSGNYVANGQTDYYRVWVVDGQTHTSNNYWAMNVGNDSSTNSYYVTMDWTTYAVPNASNYYIEHSTDNFSTWEYQFVGSSSPSFNDYGSGWTAGSYPFDVPYKTEVQHDYQSWALNGIAYSSGSVGWSGTPTLHMDNTSNGTAFKNYSSSGYTDNGQSFTYYVFPFNGFGSSFRIYNTTGISMPFTFPDNDASSCGVDLAWDTVYTPIQTNEYKVYKVDDIGDVYFRDWTGSSSFTDDNSGWSYEGNGYVPTVTSNIVWYTNSVTPPSGNSKIFKQDSEHGWTYNYYRDGDISAFTDLFTNINTPWTAGSKVQTGYVASGQTITNRIYSKRLAGIGIFSTNYTDAVFTDTNNDSSYFTITWNWTAGTNADSYRQLRDINGGGFNYYYDIATNYFSGDTNSLWVGGTPATTPTSNGYGLFIDQYNRLGTNGGVPASSSEPGTANTFTFDDSYIYRVNSSGVPQRASISWNNY